MYTLYVAVGITFYLLTSTQMPNPVLVNPMQVDRMLSDQKEMIGLERMIQEMVTVYRTCRDVEMKKQIKELHETANKRIKEIKSTLSI